MKQIKSNWKSEVSKRTVIKRLRTNPRCLGPRELGRILHCSEDKVYRMIRQGKMPAIVFVTSGDLANWIESQSA